MFIELTPEQRQLRAELRSYFSNLISPGGRRGDGVRPAQRGLPGGDQADGPRRQTRGRLAEGVRRPGFGPIEQQIFVNEAAARTFRCPR